MTKRCMILTVIGAISGGICLFCLGLYFGFEGGIVAGGYSASMQEFQMEANHMADDLENGSCETVVEAINHHLSLLEKYRGKNNLILPEKTYYADQMLAYARLLVIEEHLGDMQTYKKHLGAAMAACEQRGWQDCSESKIRRFGDAFMKSRPSVCLGSQK